LRHLPKPELEPASDAMRPLAHRNERRAGPMAWWRLTCIKPARAFRVSMDTLPFAPHVHGRCGSPIPEETSMRSRPFVVLLAWLALLVGQVAPAAANDLTRSVTSGDIAVNFGVVPANQTAAAGGSAADASSNVNLYLLTVALFDRSTGKRIENAHITAVVKARAAKPARFTRSRSRCSSNRRGTAMRSRTGTCSTHAGKASITSTSRLRETARRMSSMSA
jgi:hypothetical protein